MKQLLSDAINSPTAVTFVDALTIIRSIRVKGQTCIQYQEQLVSLLDHPKITKKAQTIIEQALGSELKSADRQRQRSCRTITSRDHGKIVRIAVGATLNIELKSQHGFYWEHQPSHSHLKLELISGAKAKAGYETFACQALSAGQDKVRLCLIKDARFSKKDSLRSPASNEFYIDLMVEA